MELTVCFGSGFLFDYEFWLVGVPLIAFWNLYEVKQSLFPFCPREHVLGSNLHEFSLVIYIPTCGKWTRMTRVSIGPILFCSIMFVGGFLHVTVGDLEIQFLICSFPCLFLLLQSLLSFLVNLFWNFLDIDEIWMSLAYANDELSVLYYYCSKLFQKENKIVFFNFVSFFFLVQHGLMPDVPRNLYFMFQRTCHDNF